MHHAIHSVSKINFPPDSLDGYQLSFSNVEKLPPYLPEFEMSMEFPKERVHISRNRTYRRNKFRELFNVNHYKSCTVEKFHTTITPKCKCIFCLETLERSHVCPTTWDFTTICTQRLVYKGRQNKKIIIKSINLDF